MNEDQIMSHSRHEEVKKMVDIERTTKGLRHCLARYIDGLCDDCPFMGEIDRSYMIPMKCKELIMKDALTVINEQQAEIDRLKAEQPKIIRCKDCKYGVKHELDLSNMYECGYPFTIVQEGHFGDFFCAMAEPKEGEKK